MEATKHQREQRLRERVTTVEEKLEATRAELRRLQAVHGRPHDRLSMLLHAAAVPAEAGAPPVGTEVVALHGLRMAVPVDSGLLSQRLRTEQWLPFDDLAMVRQFVVGGVMLDIGANIGTTTIPRAVLGDFARIYCAEPNHLNYRALTYNIAANGLSRIVSAIQCAVSDENAQARLVRANSMGGHRLSVESEGETVEVVTIDHWLSDEAIDPAIVRFVKVDAQGWDVRVMQGAKTLIGRGRAFWQIEVHPGLMTSAGSMLADLVGLAQAAFTHVFELGGHVAGVHAVEEIDRVLATLDRRPFVNLLLWNAGRRP